MVVLEEPIKEVKTLKNCIDGEWVESKSDRILDVVNPATCKVMARVALSTLVRADPRIP